MSDWAEELLNDIHNIGFKDSLTIEELVIELKDFKEPQLNLLITNINLLKSAAIKAKKRLI